jgi:hypothetical protein
MVVNFVAQPSLADLVQALKLVQTHGVAIRHDEAVKHNRQSLLAEVVHGLDLA